MTPASLLLLAALASAAPSYDEGMAARRRGELDKAREIFSGLLEQDPKNGGALEGLSLVSLSQRRYEEAADTLDRWASSSLRQAAWSQGSAAQSRPAAWRAPGASRRPRRARTSRLRT